MKIVNKHAMIEGIMAFLLILLGFNSIRQCTKVPDIPVNPKVKTDTVYKTKVFVPKSTYKYLSIPKYVYLYPPSDTAFIEKVLYTPGEVKVVFVDSSSVKYNPQFLGRYPDANKLIQMTTNRGQMQLTTLNTRGILQTDLYDFNPALYNYNYYGNTLTYQKRSFYQNLIPTSEVMIRPIDNMWDLNIGLSYKTRNTQYELGINGHYYPATSWGYGPYLKVKHNFDIWRKR